ncbi:cytochrome p450 monooxygenase [Colletotrichum kahawae]|uniref:Cytochrome p450 monooxygenase n=1 Tax=Colletotrichum kahawae TaxID=34407 RepID=A0AAD9Y2A6_COLKA|nr:cytochrome p450 monooxygenase [Colletotrichum kahawae]
MVAIMSCIGCALVYAIIQRAYPRPLPGIPYNHQAAGRVMGDLAELGERQKSGEEQAARHRSAITQIFLGPFAKPAVLISDYREANDILSHQDAVDFKRGKKVDVFSGILPHAHPAMETFDPRFRGSRDLVRDLMTPSFLNTVIRAHKVNAPHTYDVACNLIELWRVKARIARGRPFEVFNDIVEFSFDSILSAATGLGPEGGDVQRQLTHLQSLEVGLADAFDGAALDQLIMLPALSRSTKLAALGVDEESLWKGFYMPWPRLYHRINQLRPTVRSAGRTLRGFINSQITSAVPKLMAGGGPQCALDYVIQREIKAAERAGREHAYDDPRIRDEIYGYLIAGHDTSAGSLTWLMRRLLAHPEEQTKIRADLRASYGAAWQQKRLPTADELTKHAPYLDAFIEEVLRFNCPVVTIMVTTRQDTVVLGHPIPGDTQVFLNLTGPSLNMPSVSVDEEVRSLTSQKHRPSRENWDDLDPDVFRPERWIVEEAGGRIRFDPSRGPTLAFSAGNRGCWGKRLGYLELRIVLTLLIWSFELEVPEQLVSWETYDSLVTAPKRCILRVVEIDSEKE